jgi:hypothetical protein
MHMLGLFFVIFLSLSFCDDECELGWDDYTLHMREILRQEGAQWRSFNLQREKKYLQQLFKPTGLQPDVLLVLFKIRFQQKDDKINNVGLIDSVNPMINN